MKGYDPQDLVKRTILLRKTNERKTTLGIIIAWVAYAHANASIILSRVSKPTLNHEKKGVLDTQFCVSGRFITDYTLSRKSLIFSCCRKMPSSRHQNNFNLSKFHQEKRISCAAVPLEESARSPPGTRTCQKQILRYFALDKDTPQVQSQTYRT